MCAAVPKVMEEFQDFRRFQIPCGSEFGSEFFCLDPGFLQILPIIDRFFPDTRERRSELWELFV